MWPVWLTEWWAYGIGSAPSETVLYFDWNETASFQAKQECNFPFIRGQNGMEPDPLLSDTKWFVHMQEVNERDIRASMFEL